MDLNFFFRKNFFFAWVGVSWCVLGCVLPVSADITLLLPCIHPDSNPKPKCPFEFIDCKNVLPRIKDTVRPLITKKINYLYLGYDVDPFLTKSESQPVGTAIHVPVCNLEEKEITEPDKNRSPPPLVKDCGEYHQYVVGETDTKTGRHGSREIAYMNGFYAQALKCYREQVFNELDQMALTVKFITSAALDIQKQREELMSLLSSLAIGVACSDIGQKCPNTADQCTDPFFETSACAKDSICKIIAAEDRIQSAYEYVTYQEIVLRAKSSWNKFLISYEDDVYNKVEMPCYNQNVSRCYNSGLLGAFVKIQPECIPQIMNSCYPNAYLGYMKNLIHDLYPDSGLCKDL